MHYRVERQIGCGSFGAVFQVVVEETGEVVAIKKIFQDKRIKNRELQIMRQLHHGGGTHLYGYGPHASPRSFGHAGFRTTLAFCDPEAALVVTCSWNGMVADDRVHSDRQNALCAAVYEDLGLAAG